MTHEFLSSEIADGSHVITFTGKSFASSEQAFELKTHCEELLEGELCQLVINLENLGFISSIVIGQIFLINCLCDAKGVALRLTCPHGPLRQALSTVGVDKILAIDDSVGEAIRTATAPDPPQDDIAVTPVDQLQSEAESGCGTAQFELARRYETGRGITQDPDLALSWFLRAANTEHAEAQYRVGQAFAFGIATAQDFDRALEWYRRSSENGNSDAKRAVQVAEGIELE
jgi:anti-anti-sigma factor